MPGVHGPVSHALMNACLPPSQRSRWRLGGRRIASQQLVRRIARLLDQRNVAFDVGEAQQRHAGLARAEELAGPADQQVLPRDLEAVGRLEDRP